MRAELNSKMEFECKDLTILFVDDEKIIREHMGKTLGRFFQKVIVAANGAEAIAIVHRDDIDIIVTDVRMPEMDGLAMSKIIKEVHPEIPIIIASAYNDSDHLMEAIEYGVDGFVIKPINFQKLCMTILKSAKAIRLEKEAETYKEDLKQLVVTEINDNLEKEQETARVLSEILNAYPNPVIVFHENGDVHYINRIAEELFELCRESILYKPLNLDNNCIEYNEEHKKLSEITIEDKVDNLVAIKTKNGKKIYRVLIDEIIINDERELIYTFNDITLDEYRKLKIKHYSDRLEESVLKYKKLVVKVDELKVLKQQVEVAKKVEEMEKIEEEVSEIHHISALNFYSELDDYVLEGISELKELESDIHDVLYSFEFDATDSILNKLSDMFFKYSTVVSLMFEFSNLSVAIKGVSNFLHLTKIEELTKESRENLILILRSLVTDLHKWRVGNFEEKNSVDIHYLDKSLLTNCLQLEMIVLDNNQVFEWNKLDLF